VSRTQDQMEQAYQALLEEAYMFCCDCIQRVCDSEGLDFYSLYSTICKERGEDSEEKHATDSREEIDAPEEIWKVISWYEGQFGVYPDSIYENGEWTNGPERTEPGPLLEGHKKNFATMMEAADNGDLALVSAIRKRDRANVALVCAISAAGGEMLTPVPFAVMVEGDPYELFEDPTVINEEGG